MSNEVIFASVSGVASAVATVVVSYFKHRSAVEKAKADTLLAIEAKHEEAIRKLDEKQAERNAPLITQTNNAGVELLAHNKQLRAEQDRLLDLVVTLETRIDVIEFLTESLDRARVFVDSRGTILKVSPGFLALFKRTPAGCIGHSLKEFMDAASWARHESAFTHRQLGTTAVPGCAVGNAVDSKGNTFLVSVDTTKSSLNYRTGLWTYLADISVVGD